MSSTEHPETRHFSVGALPAPERMGLWREVFARKVVNLEIESLDDAPLHYDATFRSIAGASVAFGSVSSISCERTRSMTSDANDDMVIVVPISGKMMVEQRGQAVDLGMGDALVRRSDEPGKTWSTAGRFLTITLPQSAIAGRLSDADGMIMTVLRRGAPALDMLTGYARMLVDDHMTAPGPLSDLAVAHLSDLATLALGSSRDDWLIARARGLRSARLAALESAIAGRATEPGITIADLARQTGISPGYARRLLAEGGAPFSARIMSHRLDRARAALVDPRHDARSVSDIAYDTGFGDISYFNRAFRQRYGHTPSDARAARG